MQFFCTLIYRLLFCRENITYVRLGTKTVLEVEMTKQDSWWMKKRGPDALEGIMFICFYWGSNYF